MAERLTLDELKALLAQYSQDERFELAEFCLTGNRQPSAHAWDFLSLDRLPLTVVECEVIQRRNLDFWGFSRNRIARAHVDAVVEKVRRGDRGRETYPDVDYVSRFIPMDQPLPPIPAAAFVGTPEGLAVLRDAQAAFEWAGVEILPPEESAE